MNHSKSVRATNFGLGSRNMAKAGAFALRAQVQAGASSFASAATNSERWAAFAAWAKAQGVTKMEAVTPEVVMRFGKELSNRVATADLAASTAQNYVSAINSVMAIATKNEWQSVSPTKDCGIAQRSAVRSDAPPGLDRAVYTQALEAVRESLGERAAAITELAREIGLRSKEASLLHARSALAEATQRGSITVFDGTKGGLSRTVPINTPEQMQALERAAAAQADARAVMPANQNWKSWRAGGLREIRELIKEITGEGLHSFRSAYACERYQTLTGHAAPAAGGKIVDKEIDRQARLAIAKELGHGRIQIVAEYVGGRA